VHLARRRTVRTGTRASSGYGTIFVVPTLRIAQDAPADELLSRDPLALLLGMLLDQQFPMERAFGAPRLLADRLGVDGLDAAALADYAGVCGLLLAKGHARTSGASMIAGYLGGSDKAVEALCRFARRYADQTERDHAALVAAIHRGVLRAEPGI
jgi:uncharacterized HhH-GPD family protein